MKYVVGPYTQGQLLKDIHEVEIALTEHFLYSGAITVEVDQNSWRDRVIDASHGKNTVIFDDQGNPSIMVKFPLKTEADMLSGGRNMPHPAFLVGSTSVPELYIAKYQCIVSGSGVDARALSLKFQDPKTYINFDDALAACGQKGSGWHLMTNAEWAAIALWCKMQGFWPRGNNLYGKDYAIISEKGIPSYYYDSSGTKYIGRVLTGSGPLAWTHDGSPFGIYDLNGNVWEWVGGLRINDGEINVLENNNAADNTKDQTASSIEWKAFLEDGSLVAPGAVGTLKYDATNADGSGNVEIDTVIDNQSDGVTYAASLFEDIVASAGVSVPDLMTLLALSPIDNDHGSDMLYARNIGERLPLRGGNWSNASGAGVFSLNLSNARSGSNHHIGFRSAFCNL